jgi:hypothetical protein
MSRAVALLFLTAYAEEPSVARRVLFLVEATSLKLQTSHKFVLTR